MCDIYCVTNRRLCKTDFFQRINEIAECKPSGIILREKDMSESDYEKTAKRVMEICGKYNVKCILHNFYNTAKKLGAESIHLPLHILRTLSESERAELSETGASCHSESDAAEAEKLGCSYIAAGHIFATDCKKGVMPRGLDFLHNVCESVNIPVLAIGGINADNCRSAVNSGAAGVCIMSGFMCCNDTKKYYEQIRRSLNEI